MPTRYLSIVGISIIVLCVLSFVFPYGQRLRDKVQKFQGFGVNTEISVITLFLLIGAALSCSGIIVELLDYKGKLLDYKGKLDSATADRHAAIAKTDAAEAALARAQKLQLSLLISLDGVTVTNMPNIEDLRAQCVIVGLDDPVEIRVSKGVVGTQFRFILNDLNRDTFIRSLGLEETRQGHQGRKWIYDQMFAPFEPSYILKEVRLR